MKSMNFYTANGWAGSNYNGQPTKEIAKLVREYAKKNFPEFKFSIRYSWSMYTDTLYVELKGGPFLPFVDGSRSAERGYLSTTGSITAWHGDITPEVFKAFNGVVTYANSYRYDDSDSMQDYFDTNFYLSIRISEDYKVIEPKRKASNVIASDSVPAAASPACDGLEVVGYSEKAIVVFGDTKAVKDELKAMGGRFNGSLNYNGGKRAGWVFSRKNEEEVRRFAASVSAPSVIEGVPGVDELPAPPSVVVLPDEKEEYPLSAVSYEKRVTGKRFEVSNKPLTLGYVGITDNLDNSIIDCYPTREEAEREADRLNGLTDADGRLRRAAV